MDCQENQCKCNLKMVCGDPSESNQGSHIQEVITNETIFALKDPLESIENGGSKRLTFKTMLSKTCSSICDSKIIQYGICNFGLDSCKVSYHRRR